MAVPKKKMSRSRTRRRKSEAMKLPRVQTVTCPTCGQPKRPHRACTSKDGCGTYNERPVVEISD